MEENRVIKTCKVLIFGGSSGSLDVLMHILPRLSRIPSFAFVIVLHRKSGGDTVLEGLVALKTIIPVKEVEDKVDLLPGFIYIAPSDYHLLFENDNSLSLDASEKINHSRPSIDVSFESASEVYGDGLIGVLVSGANSDGTEGLKAIKNAGGMTVVQKPETASMPFMPQYAVSNTSPDYILDLDGIFEFINSINS